ncbi:hypothetical protein UFOVP1008_14 [uncultured Caudovirales phage]|uniref:Uncharacterized protein n=1 Tax=uncultured Caudovirales phage TaxID=2100421 RepID=A0A6J5S0P2_9CAUD|nr:hypothetical protein UFOVP498_22 [uncultured Caudovirales phage]CAB4177579.1 hypothetical protein UFOVP1008_14 [uncultured Caudovirales phage]CAB4187356.1 hypothetical protein UFOVP1160_32 [uncultured Caudovirales phage]CAB4199851.1 hypothetical protein UFOVP1352_18 [uncultured Caudovirales phage]
MNAAALAIFLTETKGSCLARWKGRMTASEQRGLFGRFLGKGTIYINGADETVEHWVKTGFGMDADCTASIKWSALSA